METSTTKQKNKVIHTSNQKNSIIVRYEDKDGIRQTEEFPIDWYFAIRRDKEEEVEKLINTYGYRFKFERDPKFPDYTKVHMRQPEKYGEPRDRYDVVAYLEDCGIETFEGDLPNDKRWYVDKQVTIADTFKKLYFDIETDDSIGKIEIGRDRIVSWAAVDDKGKVYFEALESMTDKAEEELLVKFLKVIKKYDILLGWNSKEFDIPYLKMRMRKYGLHKSKLYAWRDVASFDLLKRFRHIFRFDNGIKKYSLEAISQHFLERGKIKHTEKIHELYANNKPLLKEYNIEDCNLVKDLDDKLGVSNMMILQSQWCGVPPAQFGLYAIIDSYIMKTAHNMGQFCRTSVRAIKERDFDKARISKENPDDATKSEAKYTGAAVLDPIVGMYDKVYTFDFKSLYPSMMRSSNIGFDSIRYEDDGIGIINPGTKDITRKSGTLVPTFFDQKASVINVAITELLKKRKEYKKIKLQMIEEGTNDGPGWERVVSDEIIVKELANSTYGIMGLEYGRYFSVDVAESITLFGQWVINFAKKFFESRGYQVIYGDTDSVFVAAGKEMDVKTELKFFHESLEKELKEQFRINDCYIELEPDKIFEKLILIAKKSYVGHVVDIEGKKTNDIYARGIDYIKKNTFGYAAVKQKDLIDRILRKGYDLEKIRKYVDGTKQEFYSKEWTPKELAIVQRIGKMPKDYKNPPLAAILAMEQEWRTGVPAYKTEVEFIVTDGGKGKNKSKQKGVLLEDFAGEFDKDWYWESKTVPILDRITSVAFPETIDLYSISKSLFG